VLQIGCISRAGGAVQNVKRTQLGIVNWRDGQIVHAETLATPGQSALLEIVGWSSIEFAYDGAVRSPAETITLPWDAALIDAVKQYKQTKTAQQMPTVREV